MHDLIDHGTAYHRTHLDLPKQRLLERYRLTYFDSIHDGHSELWWQGFIEIYTEEYPCTVLDRRFTSQARYEESVRLLREVLEQWMDVRGGRIAKLTAYYSTDHRDTKHGSNTSCPTDVLETNSSVHSEREDPQSDGIQHATTGRILQWRARVAEAAATAYDTGHMMVNACGIARRKIQDNQHPDALKEQGPRIAFFPYITFIHLEGKNFRSITDTRSLDARKCSGPLSRAAGNDAMSTRSRHVSRELIHIVSHRRSPDASLSADDSCFGDPAITDKAGMNKSKRVGTLRQDII
ncbi:uncharacterized protein EV420DRAFT_1730084 [Desarmillaria tabescens]|uniref:Uncharacterized protein n=1 Tax=Armillaria tabescens TaxID=1929756 RepID=A0AA39JFK5_ARMTA|nr:uncharacterized protein EV420DRAFT_1730084 [Desarmillaria tabescens]KAK0441479.1 hypothetical protein EV420DRAFT_1730084 [Desarmillaria tabescens]